MFSAEATSQYRSRSDGPAYARLSESIRHRILTGDLKPGDRLPSENDLAQRSGFGRSTVREALRHLESEHLITTVRGVTGGTFVSAPQPERVAESLTASLEFLTGTRAIAIAELLDARELLEVPAAARAAARCDQAGIGLLEATLSEERRLDDEGIFDTNRRFHSVVLHMSGNQLLEMMARPVFEVLRARFSRADAPPSYWRHVDDDHRAIAGAITAGDPEAAAAAMQEHLTLLHTTYSALDDRAMPT